MVRPYSESSDISCLTPALAAVRGLRGHRMRDRQHLGGLGHEPGLIDVSQHFTRGRAELEPVEIIEIRVHEVADERRHELKVHAHVDGDLAVRAGYERVLVKLLAGVVRDHRHVRSSTDLPENRSR